MMMAITDRLRQFMEDEARSCSMDFGCVTALYVYRMWGGEVPLNEIEGAMGEVRRLMWWGKAYVEVFVTMW